jgi:hypothetical protein
MYEELTKLHDHYAGIGRRRTAEAEGHPASTLSEWFFVYNHID